MGKNSARAGFFCRLTADFSHRKRYFRFLWENLPGRQCFLTGLPDISPTEKIIFRFLWDYSSGQAAFLRLPRIIIPTENHFSHFLWENLLPEQTFCIS